MFTFKSIIVRLLFTSCEVVPGSISLTCHRISLMILFKNRLSYFHFSVAYCRNLMPCFLRQSDLKRGPFYNRFFNFCFIYVKLYVFSTSLSTGRLDMTFFTFLLREPVFLFLSIFRLRCVSLFFLVYC